MIKKVNVGDLRIGVYVDELDRPWLETRFALQGFVIHDQEQLDELQRVCEYVYIDTDMGLDVGGGVSDHAHHKEIEVEMLRKVYLDALEVPSRPKQKKPERAPRERGRLGAWLEKLRQERKPAGPPAPLVPLEQELEAATVTQQRAEVVISEVLDDVRLGQSINTRGSRAVVHEMVDSVLRNPDALVCLTQLRNKDDYTATHSIDVCVLAITFGRFLGMSREQLMTLGLGTLLHDVGKVVVPDEILNKPARYTTDEFDIMKQHTTLGRDILRRTDLPAAAVELSYVHHERYNGSGYPRGLHGDELSQFARITSLVDVYSALTSDRPYRRASPPFDVLRKFYEWREDFGEEMVEEFIRCIGIYPVGSIVKLSTGDVGVVLTINHDHRLRPKVSPLLDPDGNRYEHNRVVDLMSEVEPERDRLVEIISVVHPEDHNLEPEDYRSVLAELGEHPAPMDL